MKFALAGNPNCGKTTLFNELTGSTAHVGNWPGVTVDKREGVYKKLGEGALERISENPYILVDVASKVNFEKVDRIAMEMGVEESNYKRIRSGIKYGLEKIGLNGNSCVLYDNLIKYEQDLLRVDINNIEEAINNLLSQSAFNIEIESTETINETIEAIIKANENLEKSNNSNDWEMIGRKNSWT